MSDLWCVGIDAKTQGMDTLERVVRDPALPGRIEGCTEALAARERLVLRTCNRLELWYASTAPATRAKSRLVHHLGAEHGSWTVRSGHSALNHLLRVACSLESLALGEDQILGQVRQALAGARATGTTGPVLEVAFQRALRVGKRARRDTPLGTAGGEVPRLALRHSRQALFTPHQAPVALVGTGQMAREILRVWPSKAVTPLVIVSRSEDRAREVAAPRSAGALSLKAFLSGGRRFSAVLAATCTEEPILDGRWSRENLMADAPVVDLGLPRNVCPSVADHARLIDLPTLQREASRGREQLRTAVATIEGWIETATADVERKLRSLQSRRQLAGASP